MTQSLLCVTMDTTVAWSKPLQLYVLYPNFIILILCKCVSVDIINVELPKTACPAGVGRQMNVIFI